MNRKIVDKFFINQATPGETRRVLEWFDTPEGKKYLQSRLDMDSGLMDRKELQDLVSDLDSERLYKSIQAEIRKKRNVFSLHRRDWVGYTMKAAAAVLVIITASLFSISHQQYVAEQVVEQQPVFFQTGDEENRSITLSDRTEIRLNKNSEVIVSADYMNGKREVTLSGEAYFDVEHNPDQPFIIHANQSSVEVLGTAFNVRSVEDQKNVQVAVLEGRVALQGAKNGADSEELSVILSKNQYGYLDLENRSLNVDDVAVGNYLAWKSGRFNFEELTMEQVCRQLNRIYDIECSYSGNEIRDLKLTASFSNESLEKALEVISMSLELDYERQDEIVKWTEEHSAHLNEVK